MKSQFLNNRLIKFPELPANRQLGQIETGSKTAQKPVYFQADFEGYMEMYSNPQTVAEYLNAHEGWFCRCAQPMQVEPLGDNGYILIIGRFGSFGYQVEPKIAVVLQPSKDGTYLMHTIPVPNYNSPGYEVDYQASMELLEIPAEFAAPGMAVAYQKKGQSELPTVVTRVRWQLQLEVAVEFPKFIHKLPLSLIQTTGDRLLSEIVRQVSPRLTYKVQQDFHSRLDLPMPPKGGRKFQKISRVDMSVA